MSKEIHVIEIYGNLIKVKEKIIDNMLFLKEEKNGNMPLISIDW